MSPKQHKATQATPLYSHKHNKESATLKEDGAYRFYQVAKSYFTLSTIALKAAGLFKARSARTLRLISIPAL